MDRPTFNPTGLPEALKARAVAQSLRSWVVVSETNFPWFLATKERADVKVAALNGKATVFAPVA